jgi:hypothetical protein
VVSIPTPVTVTLYQLEIFLSDSYPIY